jgi:hypothetical protein
VTPTILTRVASCAAVLALAFLLTGCGMATHETTTAAVQPAATTDPASEALRKYIAAVQATIPTTMKTFGDLYSAFTITASGTSTMVYEYTFTRQVDAVAGVKAMKGMTPTLQTACDTQVFPEMKRAGINSPRGKYSYVNADGSKIWSKTFKPK